MTTRMVMRCLAHMAIMLLAACGDEQADAAGTPIVDSRVRWVRLASDSGLHYEWLLEEVHDNGDTVRQEFRYLEAWAGH